MIVGSAEAKPREGKISNETPLGAAMLGTRKNQKVTVQTSGGGSSTSITLSIFYPDTLTLVASDGDGQLDTGQSGVKVVAANRGKVLLAEELGIYGNCVILDHGMGVQSLYGHLSSIGVKAGDMVEKEQELGRSGMTGLAGGDHLHFTMLVNGHMVNPVEWWDQHWIQDRILRKLKSE